MAIQLTAEQEERILAAVNAGIYPSAKEALDAAINSVDPASAPGFEGTPQELNELIMEGINSGEPVVADAAFWSRLIDDTDLIIAEHQNREASHS